MLASEVSIGKHYHSLKAPQCVVYSGCCISQWDLSTILYCT
eukprot:COSAG02_NODE_74564_length_156_cov_5388.210526_1_plen_40_part_01